MALIEQSIQITAVICTYNRVAFLSNAIDSLIRQSLPREDYEILVIDNGSTDGTPEMIQRYLAVTHNVTLRSYTQPILGLSYARNLAVQMAAGKIIAFLDDDAMAAPQWLAALLDVYATFPDAWVVGGKVAPIWEGTRPAWLEDHLLEQLSLLDLGKHAVELSSREELYGVNCSFHRHAFAKVGLFRTDLGRHGHHLMGSEEIELQMRIRQQHKSIVYAPEALVWHRISSERLNWRYFIRLAYRKGQTRARLALTDASHATLPWRVVRGGLGVLRQWLCLIPNLLDQTRQLYCLRITASWFGFLRETVSPLKDGSGDDIYF